ncbi:MAG: ATP-binding cassette domain-containing protein, partial [Clostridiales bacterium]|nr:ATP-binding cassette domain-containing protein [Clostridiales bacterium]
MSAFVRFEDVTKIYKTGSVEVKALSNVSFEIEKGEVCVIVGESGAGKTTLLNILGGMDALTSGKVIMDGVDIGGFNRSQLENYRRYDIC